MGHLDVVKFLVEKGANVNHTYKDGKNSLMWASWRGHLDIVKYLFDYIDNYDKKDNYGKNAYSMGNQDIKAFLQYKIDLSKIYCIEYFQNIKNPLKDHNVLKIIFKKFNKY